jgi:hypothetical protein
MTTYTGTLPATLLPPQSVPQTVTDAWYGILLAFSDTWSTYVPAWTASGTAPALGNGTITGRYAQVGKLVYCTGILTMGSTTTFGTGVWSVSLPVTAASASTGIYVGQAFLFDNSVTAGRRSGCQAIPTTTTSTAYAGGGGQIAPAAPFTWAVSDKWSWTLWYEAA